MKTVFHLLFIMLIVTGCTYQPKIFVDGKPVVDNIAYSYSDISGITTRSLLIRKYKEYENDESYISNEYFAPMVFNEFKKSNTKGIIYVLSVNNTYTYSLTGKGFYYKLYKVMKVTNHKNRTLARSYTLVYKGHLSSKDFSFELPIERGDIVSCHFEFMDKKENLMFKTLEINYEIK